MRTYTLPNGFGEFDMPFTVHPDGTVTASDDYVGEVESLAADEDGSVPDEPEAPNGWEFLTGVTGQYGYHGSIMHSSEQLSGGFVADMFDQAAEDCIAYTYCAVVIYADEPTDDPEEWNTEPIGWAVMRGI